MILHEKATWDERVLENLEAKDLGLEPFHVYVAQVSDLGILSDGAFTAMGARVI